MLEVYEFTWKESGLPSIGVIAQEVEEYAPEFVHTRNNGIKSIDYGKLAVAALFEERKKTQALEERIEKLEKLLEQML